MAQDFNNDFKVSIITEGSESNAWGGITNNNLLQISKAIGGFKTITVSGTSHTLTPADNTSDQDFRNLVLDITGSVSATPFPLNLPAIDKMYIVKNRLDRDLKVLVSGQTGVIVPTNQTAILYIDGTDVRDAITYLSSLNIGSALTVKNGGTGYSALTTGSILVGNATSSPTLLAGSSAGQVLKWSGSTWQAGSETGGGGGGSASVSLTAGSSVDGLSIELDPSTITGTGTIGLTGNINVDSVTGTLPVENGGTGSDSLNNAGIINNVNTSLQTVVSNFQINPALGNARLFFGESSSNPEFIKHTVVGSSGQIEVFTNNTLRFAVADVAVSFLTSIGAAASGLIIGSTGGRFNDIFLVNSPNVSSDKRLKNNIQDTDIGLDFINSLKPKKFKINNQEDNKFHYGLIAQEVEAVLDEKNVDKKTFSPWLLADSEDPDSDQSLRYEGFISPMMKAIQELSEKVTTLEAKVKELEAK
jgi:hypothetical protein